MSSTLKVLMFTDIVGSVDLKRRLGNEAYTRLLGRHDKLFRAIVESISGALIIQDTGDGFYAEFATPSDAVNAALRFQDGLMAPDWTPEKLRVRVGVHVGTVTEMRDEGREDIKRVGLAADMTSRLMSLAAGGQILLTRTAFDDARQFVREYPCTDPETGSPTRQMQWMAHGKYLFKGQTEPVDVFEVGAAGLAPLAKPPDSEKAQTAVDENEKEILGWRPAAGLEIPRRKQWIVERKLGAGAFGEVWLARHAKTHALSAFKFCFEAHSLQSFQRELALFNLLQTALGNRPDIAHIREVQLDHAPFFLESEFSELGDLAEWAEQQGGIQSIPLCTRLDIVARVAQAAEAAHSIGILHKDIKPGNILMFRAEDGSARPKLGDFGIGAIFQTTNVPPAVSTAATTDGGALTTSVRDGSSGPTTPMYMPPEMQAGALFTVQGDCYALGVLLYQMVAGNLRKPLAEGWQRNIPDELLKEDIAACVDGEPERRMSAATLAQHLHTLEERRAERAKAEKIKRQMASRKRLTRLSLAVAAALTILVVVGALGLVRERKLRNQAVVAEVNARLRQAEAVAFQGDAMFAADQPIEARRLYEEASGRFRELGAPNLVSELGIWDLNRSCTWPIASWEADGRDADGKPLPLRKVVFSPSGEGFIAVGDGPTFYLRDSRTGSRLHAFIKHSDFVTAVAFWPRGNRLVSGGADLSLYVWSTTRDEPERGRPLAHQMGISALAVSPDGRRIVSAGWDKTLKVWNAQTLELLQTFGGEESAPFIRCIAFSPDGALLACGLMTPVSQPPATQPASSPSAQLPQTPSSHTIRLYRCTDDGKLEFASAIEGHTTGVSDLAFCPTGSGCTLVSGGVDGTVRIWNTRNGQLLRTFTGHRDAVQSVAFSPDGRTILSAGSDRNLKLWHLDGDRPARNLSGHTAKVNSAVFTPDGRRAISVSDDGTIKAWAFDAGRDLRAFRGHAGAVTTASLSPGGRRVLTASADRTLKIWDAESNQELLTLSGHKGWIFCAAFNPAGMQVVSGSQDRTLRIWDARTGASLSTLEGHIGSVLSCAYSPDGYWIASGGRDQTVRIWDARTGKPVRTLAPAAPATTQPSLSGGVTCLAWSPDGKRLVSGGYDAKLRVWDPAGGTLLNTSDGLTSYITSIAFCPSPASGDNMQFACSTGSGQIHLFGLTGAKPIKTFYRRGAANQSIGSISISADGQWIAGAMGKSICFWDLCSGAEELRSLSGHNDVINTVAFDPSAGGRIRLVTASWDRTARLWDLGRPAEERELAQRCKPAWEQLRQTSGIQDPKPAAMIAQWYAFCGVNGLAADMFDRALSIGATNPPPPAAVVARCHWCKARELARHSETLARNCEALVANCVDLPSSCVNATEICEHLAARCVNDSRAKESLEKAFRQFAALKETGSDAERALYSLCWARTDPNVAGPLTRPSAGTENDGLAGMDDHSAAARPVRFVFESSASPPGRRELTQIDASTWEERAPDGSTRRYIIVGRITGNEQNQGRQGTLVSPKMYRNLQLLIPDCGSKFGLEYGAIDPAAGKVLVWNPWARIQVIDCVQE